MASDKKIQEVIKHLVDKQFEFAGHQITFDDVLGVQDWFSTYKMTCEQSDAFRKYAYQYVKKALRLTKDRAESEVGWFGLQYGLSLSDPENFGKSKKQG